MNIEMRIELYIVSPLYENERKTDVSLFNQNLI